VGLQNKNWRYHWPLLGVLVHDAYARTCESFPSDTISRPVPNETDGDRQLHAPLRMPPPL
jgi:hypothetical protein